MSFGRVFVVQVAVLLAASWTAMSVSADDAIPLNIAGQLAFVDASNSLIVLDGQTGIRRRIVGPPLFRAAAPAWSPDGTSIAVVGNEIADGPDGMHGLYVVPASGGAVRRLLSGGAHIMNVRWLPDGKRLVYVSALQGGGWRVHLVRADGSGDIVLPGPVDHDPASIETDPVVSADGSRIAFGYASCGSLPGAAGCRSGISTVTPDREMGPVLVETTEQGGVSGPTWTADGQIAYSSGTSVHVVASDASAASVLVDVGVPIAGAVTFAPDGSMAHLVQSGPPSRFGLVPWALQVIAPSGSVVAQISDLDFNPGARTQWTADGTRLFFATGGSDGILGMLDVRTGERAIIGDAVGFNGFDWHSAPTGTAATSLPFE
jgi:dipeptidyl aminopeptidase/acylaminoacyl peptidase